jgi:hypothetical protein
MSVEHPLMERSGPPSCLFYVVAKLGGSHRPLAVASRVRGLTSSEAIQGCRVIESCLNAIRVLGDAANRQAILGELALADDFYRGGGSPQRRDTPYGNRRLVTDDYETQIRPWETSFREFPFLLTCLLLGIAYDPENGSCFHAQPEPLGVVYKDDSKEYGMAVIDISDLDNIRYGIVAFVIHMLLDDAEDVDDDDDDMLDEAGYNPTVEEARPRIPLSAVEYMAKFDFKDAEASSVHHLQELPLVDASVLHGEFDIVRSVLMLFTNDDKSFGHLKMMTRLPTPRQHKNRGTDSLLLNLKLCQL